MKNFLYWFLFVALVTTAIWGIPRALERFLSVDEPMLTVTSGSMWPVLKKGDLIFIRSTELEDIKIGTLVVFQHKGGLAVHRVVRIKGDIITTRGDANPNEDSPINYNSVVGRVSTIGNSPVKIPLIGSIALIMNPGTKVSQEGEPAPGPAGVLELLGLLLLNPIGFIVLILLPIGLLFSSTIADFVSRWRPQGIRKRRHQKLFQRLEKRWGEVRAKRALRL